MKKPTILFIGAGRMAEAMTAGLLSSHEEKQARIIVSNRTNMMRLDRIKKQYNVETALNWPDVLDEADAVVLAVPPHEHHEILGKLRKAVSKQLIVTIAAGIGPSVLEEALPDSAVSWIMPNTAAQIGESISLYCKGTAPLTEFQEGVLQTLLDSIGRSEECTEDEILKLTAVTGSAPAFIYLFAEILTSKAIEYGIQEDKAERLVKQMISGTSAMISQFGSPASLREQVTTPGGSTAEGIHVLEEAGFEDLIKKAVEAVNSKS